ncbi:MAG: hypothetical protein Fur0014_03550 [Rubrivivax sp.]
MLSRKTLACGPAATGMSRRRAARPIPGGIGLEGQRSQGNDRIVPFRPAPKGFDPMAPSHARPTGRTIITIGSNP